MLRAQLQVCLLVCPLQWHMEQALKASLFSDEVPGGAPRESPVGKASRSDRAQSKAASKRDEDGHPVHRFTTLLADLATLCQMAIRPAVARAGSFPQFTEFTTVQAKALGGMSGVTFLLRTGLRRRRCRR
jgi:hypothetical protein